ncbi:MAG: transporter [Nitrospiraceae bacterium]|nr:transporter [Nitrospiraceae bacterium]
MTKTVNRLKTSIICFIAALCCTSTASALHPLLTDDTGVQGKGKYELELGYKHERNSDAGVKTRTSEFAATLAIGASDSLDVELSLPYRYIRTKDSGDITNEDGLADSYAGIKWKLFEKDGLSLALKTGVTMPSGDYKRGLGTGRAGYQAFVLATKEFKPFAVHLNAGWIGNQNRIDERRNIWHLSAAAEYEFVKNLRAVADVGTVKNKDKTSGTNPVYMLGGLVYTVNQNLDLDIGIKGGLNKAENDVTYLLGITFRF